jgi:hypothetical protein
MVQSEQRGLTRRQNTCGWRGRGSAKRSGLGALAVLALLAVVIIVSTTGCGSSTQTSASTTASVSAAGQTGTGQSLPSGAPTGAPTGTAPSGRPGGTTSSTDTAGTTTTTTAAADTTATTEAATTTTSLADGQYGDGIYKAGTDISTGLYLGAVVGSLGHWEISSDANGDKYVAGDDPTGQFYVKVTWGQYLSLSGVIIEKAGSTAADPLATSALANGTYRVGYDIAVGWYNGTVTGNGMGYWQISSDANGQTLVANDYPLGPFTLKVTKGQYLTLRGVTVTLQQ